MMEPQQVGSTDPGRRVVVAGFVVIVVVGLALVVWGWGRGAASNVSIHELWLRPEEHANERVSTTGTVRVFLVGTPMQHYAIEDAAQNRVGLRGILQTTLDELVDQEVRVEGTLRVTRDRGILIDVSSIDPSGS